MANLFWDSNVFIAFLNKESEAYDIDSIAQYIEETQNNKHRIFTSGIAFVEITSSRIRNPNYDTFQEFLDDFESLIIPISPDPNILTLAGELKDLKYKKNNSNKRILTTGDATMLATALELEEVYSTSIDYFHTFDKGNGPRSVEGGKGIPLLTFEEWCEGLEDDPLAKRVIKMKRCEPIHPEKPLL